MINRRPLGVLIALYCYLLSSGHGQVIGGEFNERLNIGDAAPTWKDLEGVDGKPHSLADLQNSPTVLVVFMSANCPVALAYEDRLNALAKEFGSDKMAIVAISSNNKETLAKMKSRAKEKSYAFQYVRDADQQLARQYGATCTPHVFLLNKARKIVYMGAIDDNKNSEKVKQNYLHDALRDVLADATPSKPETRQFGCGIKWAR